MTESLGEAFPKELARVREILALYKEIGPAGMFSAGMIEAELKLADEAVANGDVVAMIRSYKSLQEITG